MKIKDIQLKCIIDNKMHYLYYCFFVRNGLSHRNYNEPYESLCKIKRKSGKRYGFNMYSRNFFIYNDIGFNIHSNNFKKLKLLKIID